MKAATTKRLLASFILVVQVPISFPLGYDSKRETEETFSAHLYFISYFFFFYIYFHIHIWNDHSLSSTSHGGSQLFFFFFIFLSDLRVSPPLAPHHPPSHSRRLRFRSPMAWRSQWSRHPLVTWPPWVPRHGQRLGWAPSPVFFSFRLRGSSRSDPLALLPLLSGLEVRLRFRSAAQGQLPFALTLNLIEVLRLIFDEILIWFRYVFRVDCVWILGSGI